MRITRLVDQAVQKGDERNPFVIGKVDQLLQRFAERGWPWPSGLVMQGLPGRPEGWNNRVMIADGAVSL